MPFAAKEANTIPNKRNKLNLRFIRYLSTLSSLAHPYS